MKTLNFVIEIKIETFYKSQTQEILVISIPGERLGFICVNKFPSEAVSRNETIIPFTEHGALANEDCIASALSTLFFIKTNIKIQDIEIAEIHKSPVSPILSSLLSAAKREKESQFH